MLKIETIAKNSKFSGHFKYARVYMRIGRYAPVRMQLKKIRFGLKIYRLRAEIIVSFIIKRWEARWPHG